MSTQSPLFTAKAEAAGQKLAKVMWKTISRLPHHASPEFMHDNRSEEINEGAFREAVSKVGIISYIKKNHGAEGVDVYFSNLPLPDNGIRDSSKLWDRHAYFVSYWLSACLDIPRYVDAVILANIETPHPELRRLDKIAGKARITFRKYLRTLLRRSMLN